MAILILSDDTQAAAVNAVVDLIDAGAAAGTIAFYDGTMPADADTAVSTQTLIATLTFSDPAFGDATAASSVVTTATANAVTADTSIDANGTITWARVADSDGNVVFDCDVTNTGGGGTITMANTTVTAGGTLELTAFTVSLSNGS